MVVIAWGLAAAGRGAVHAHVRTVVITHRMLMNVRGAPPRAFIAATPTRRSAEDSCRGKRTHHSAGAIVDGAIERMEARIAHLPMRLAFLIAALAGCRKDHRRGWQWMPGRRGWRRWQKRRRGWR